MNDVLNEVTQQFLMYECATVYDINNGSCQDWAEAVKERLENTQHDVQVWTTPFGIGDTSHVFLRIDGKFFDAECLQGCDDHMELPIFARIGTRQPVWLEDHNGKMKLGAEDRRDMTDAQLTEHKELWR